MVRGDMVGAVAAGTCTRAGGGRPTASRGRGLAREVALTAFDTVLTARDHRNHASHRDRGSSPSPRSRDRQRSVALQRRQDRRRHPERQSLRVSCRRDRGGTRALQATGLARALSAQLLRPCARRHPHQGEGAHQVQALVSAGKPVAILVVRAAAGGRLDRFIAGALDVSRSEAQRWIDDGRVTVAGASRTASSTVREGEEVVVAPGPPETSAAAPDADVRFEVLHVDDAIVVVVKPPGLVVHPARGHETGTLVNGLLARGLFAHDVLDEAESSQESHLRPGIVHRLYKGTSGVMVVARTARAREVLKGQFQAHSIERAYEAIVVGAAESRTFSTMHGRHPRDRLRFTSRVSQGKWAVTHVRVLTSLRGATP